MKQVYYIEKSSKVESIIKGDSEPPQRVAFQFTQPILPSLPHLLQQQRKRQLRHIAIIEAV